MDMYPHPTFWALCEHMRVAYGAGPAFEDQLLALIDKYRAAQDRRMRDKHAADLLPIGRLAAAERLGVVPRTVYKMARRHYARAGACFPVSESKAPAGAQPSA